MPWTATLKYWSKYRSGLKLSLTRLLFSLEMPKPATSNYSIFDGSIQYYHSFDISFAVCSSAVFVAEIISKMRVSDSWRSWRSISLAVSAKLVVELKALSCFGLLGLKRLSFINLSLEKELLSIVARHLDFNSIMLFEFFYPQKNHWN